jgi:hypothetical protein
MSVPKTAVNEDCGVPARKHNIRPARQCGHMGSEPEAEGMERTPKSELGFGVLSLDTRHHPGAGRLINYICHD